MAGSCLQCDRVDVEEEKSHVFPEASKRIAQLLRGGVDANLTLGCGAMCNGQARAGCPKRRALGCRASHTIRLASLTNPHQQRRAQSDGIRTRYSVQVDEMGLAPAVTMQRSSTVEAMEIIGSYFGTYCMSDEAVGLGGLLITSSVF